MCDGCEVEEQATATMMMEKGIDQSEQLSRNFNRRAQKNAARPITVLGGRSPRQARGARDQSAAALGAAVA